jgi:hypothetical protein
VILDVLVTPAELTEKLPMLEICSSGAPSVGVCGHTLLTGDAAYGTTIENVAAVEKAGMRAYMVLCPNMTNAVPSLWQKRVCLRRRKGPLHLPPRRDPASEQGHDYKERSIRYAARPSACNQCPLKTRCTKSKKGRWLRRSFDEEYLERVGGYQDTEPCQKALRKRQVWVEPLFAEAKDWHGARRFRLRGL